MSTVQIAGHRLGIDPCFVIAEIGVNHNGDPDVARQLIDVAARAGADAVKFQSFHADRLATPSAPKAAYQVETTGSEETLSDMLRKLELSPELHRDLQAYASRLGVLFLSTPFDEESADLLTELDVPAIKVGSGELTNLPFLAYLARKSKPLILSTGMASLAEVALSLEAIRTAGGSEIVLLHCVSNYPAAPADVNLRAMQTMASEFGLPVGYSDHTLGPHVALAAVALGAVVLEKHVTLSRGLPGPDHRASIEPAELEELIVGVRAVEAALGSGRKEPAASELEVSRVARRSLTAAVEIARGEALRVEHVAIRRPGTGLPPAALPELLGRRARTDIPAATLLAWAMFE